MPAERSPRTGGCVVDQLLNPDAKTWIVRFCQQCLQHRLREPPMLARDLGCCASNIDGRAFETSSLLPNLVLHLRRDYLDSADQDSREF